jgi:hypothetical protein
LGEAVQSEARDRDGFASRADASLAGIRKAGDVIRVVVADRHEDAFLLGVIEELMPGALTCRKAAGNDNAQNAAPLSFRRAREWWTEFGLQDATVAV